MAKSFRDILLSYKQIAWLRLQDTEKQQDSPYEVGKADGQYLMAEILLDMYDNWQEGDL